MRKSPAGPKAAEAAILLLSAATPILAAEPVTSDAPPIASVVPELARLQKWNAMHGDTADPFEADDGRLYHFTCDGRGFGTQPRNLCFNRLSGPDFQHLQGELVNPMDEYGKANETGPDGATWKVCGQECVDGILYAFVARNVYGHKSKDPLMRQTSFNASLIKSADRGRTWTRSARENYDAPMWPGERFGAPGFFHFGRDPGPTAPDRADRFVYAISNNGFWNGGDDFILARCARADLPNLRAADWTFFTGGDGLRDGSWTADPGRAVPVLGRPAKLGWTSPAFVPALRRYLLVGWHVTPTLKQWFEPGEVVYEFLEAPHPWGPWTFVSSLSDRFLSTGHMYGPNLCAWGQTQRNGNVEISLFTSGCPFEDQPTGLYKMWRIPLTLSARPRPSFTPVNDTHPSIRYTGNWTVSSRRGYHDFEDDVHFSQTPGDAAEFAFDGTGVEWWTEKYRDEGPAEVLLDGRLHGAVDPAQSDLPRLARIPVFRVGGLPDGRHTLRIVNTTTNFLLIDAFAVVSGPGRAPVREAR